MSKLPLHWKIIIGLFLGIAWAFVSSALGWNDFTQNWIEPFGTIFIRLLKFIAVPLVLFSIIGGVSGLKDISRLGKMGGKTLLFYLLTTVIAVSLGLAFVNIIQPGKYMDRHRRGPDSPPRRARRGCRTAAGAARRPARAAAAA